MPTEHLNASAALVRQIRLGYDPDIASIRCVDIEKEPTFFSTGPLRHLFTHRHAQGFVSVKEAIDDIETTSLPSEYVEKLNSCLGRSVPPNLTIENTELRKNSLKVKARFRLYQLLNSLPRNSRREIEAVTRDINAATSHSLKALAQAGWMLDSKGMRIDRPSQTTLKNILIALHSRKHTQKALNPDLPAPATLSIPDDACHYDERQQRTLSVREMARIQSFPDWFTFKSKATTGGSMRRFQVPQYTQVGNAVPPLLGKALARTCRELIEAL
jgi:DNA (cytosine-5)-methyltransferase 1